MVPFPHRHAGAAVTAAPVDFQTFHPVTTERPTFPHPDFAADRIAMARADLREAELLDLRTADSADLIQMVERLRGALSDMIRLCGTAPRRQRDELDWAERVDLALAQHLDLGLIVSRLCGSLALMIFFCSTARDC